MDEDKKSNTAKDGTGVADGASTVTRGAVGLPSSPAEAKERLKKPSEKEDSVLDGSLEDENVDDATIEELILEDRKDQEENEKFLDKEEKKSRRKRILFSVLGVVVVTGTVTGLVFFNPFGGDQKAGEGKQNTVAAESNQALKQAAQKDPEGFALEKPIPFDYKEWETKPYAEMDEKTLEEVYKDMLDSANVSSLSLAADTLPSEAAGFTSDISKANNEDGTINPDFAYWTKERFVKETSVILERLTNPFFGGWSIYQYSGIDAANSFDPKIFGDIFVPEWKPGAPYGPESIPVYADWGGNDYGMGDTLSSKSRFVGHVDNVTVEFSYDDQSLQYTADLTANVSFTSWTKDQKTVTKQGVLKLHLVPSILKNIENKDNTGNRVLIESGSLQVG